MQMKRFLHCLDAVEAQHCANLLRSAGIAAEVRNIYLAGALGDIPFIEAGPQVWIEVLQDEAIAHAVLAQVGATPTQPDWCCQQCGEPIEGQFAQCWHCGAGRPGGV